MVEGLVQVAVVAVEEFRASRSRQQIGLADRLGSAVVVVPAADPSGQQVHFF